MNHFLIGLWCAKLSVFHTTTGNDQFSGWTQKKLQSTSQSWTCTKERSWSLFGGLLPVWSTTAFLNFGKTITSKKYAQQINEMNWKLQTLQPAWVSRKWLSSSAWEHLTTCHTGALNVEWIGLQCFASFACSPDLLPTDYHLFKHLDNILHGKCFPRVC